MPWDTVPPLGWILRIIGQSRTQACNPRGAAGVDGGASPPARPNGGALLIAFLTHACLILAIVRLDLRSVPAAGLHAVGAGGDQRSAAPKLVRGSRANARERLRS